MSMRNKKILFYTQVAKKLQIISNEESEKIMNIKKVQR